jgi:hypothetical protein
MFSLLDFVNTPPVASWLHHEPTGQQGRCGAHRPGDLVSADQDISCPSVGTQLSAHREDAVFALKLARCHPNAAEPMQRYQEQVHAGSDDPIFERGCCY